MAGCHTELGRIDQAQGKTELAEAEYRKSLDIWTKAGLPAHPAARQAPGYYAEMLRGIGRIDEAKEMEARARAIREESVGGSRELGVETKP